MGSVGRLAKILRNEGGREFLRVLLTGCLRRLNGDGNGDPAANGEYALLRAYLKPGTVVFDVGANVGSWTLQALTIEPSLQVYAFEPVSHLFGALEKHI